MKAKLDTRTQWLIIVGIILILVLVGVYPAAGVAIGNLIWTLGNVYATVMVKKNKQ